MIARTLAALLGASLACALGATAQAHVDVRWMDGEAPPSLAGVTFGVPWPRGQHAPSQSFVLRNARGEAVTHQSWPIAYWPDGSLKWSAHAATGEATLTGELALAPGDGDAPAGSIAVSEDAAAVVVSTGTATFRISKNGTAFIDSAERDGMTVLEDARLVCLLRNAPTIDGGGAIEDHAFASSIDTVTVEQSGPVRAVVRVEGMHSDGERSWLPFNLRLYFYSGSETVRLVHTIIYDGDEYQDFLSGLGVRFNVPMADELHDRHVRLVGADGGVFGEAVRGITGLRRDPGEAVRRAQVDGRMTPAIAEWDERVSSRLDLIPAWDDYRLAQLSPDGFVIEKRTAGDRPWIRSTASTRAAGVGSLSGAGGGGVAFGLRDFWQSYPSQLDIRDAATEQAEVTMWLWPPTAEPMDMRFYHDGMGMETFPEEIEGLEITYEDYQKDWGTPHGIARTSELFLSALATTPSREELVAFAGNVQQPPLLMASPEHILSASVLGGMWTLPDRSTPLKARIEDQLDFLVEYYRNQVEQHRWFGFWDFGDVMHTYDTDRHAWRYDVGGYAWANSELSPDLWLWYSFLRSGDAATFRLAEAMTRHTGEVDVYHLGPWRGFGTRHNVQHWGCSSKQPRVSNGQFRRMYYYLTADERVGDLLRALVDSDQTLRVVDIGRKIRPADAPPREFPALMGFGTDWASFAAAWLTEWERTGDTAMRDRLVRGMEGIGAMKHGWLAGGGGYDPDTGEFLEVVDTVGVSHLSAVFGAASVNAELLQLLDVPSYEKAWLDYCRLYNAPREQKRAELDGNDFRDFLREAHSRLTAYAAWKLDDEELAARAWEEFLSGDHGLGLLDPLETTRIDPPAVLQPVDEHPWISTNSASQWGLAAIQNLALVGKVLPRDHPGTQE